MKGGMSSIQQMHHLSDYRTTGQSLEETYFYHRKGARFKDVCGFWIFVDVSG